MRSIDKKGEAINRFALIVTLQVLDKPIAHFLGGASRAQF